MRWIVGSGVILLLIYLLFAFCSIPPIPPHGKAWTVLWDIKREIHKYAAKHNALPVNYSGFPLHMRLYRLRDPWWRPVVYALDNKGTVVLTTLGEDGRWGGEGRNSDLVLIFPSRLPNGEWTPPETQGAFRGGYPSTMSEEDAQHYKSLVEKGCDEYSNRLSEDEVQYLKSLLTLPIEKGSGI